MRQGAAHEQTQEKSDSEKFQPPESAEAITTHQPQRRGYRYRVRAPSGGCASGAFFLSIEFQETGYLLYRFNKASFGTMPRRNDFLIQMQAITQGLVVGQTGWEQKLEDNKRAAAERWASRDDFRARFDGKSNRQFVTELFANAGVTPLEQEREDLISRLDSALATRGSVLRRVSENAEFSRQEKNPAFVLMQYFGYLHRNPNEGPDQDWSGFNFWLHKLDEHGGDFHAAEMVKAFLVSGEYRSRFEW
jgi:hypothetical protein